MNYVISFLYLVAASVTFAEAAGPQTEPIKLRAANGAYVSVVAIYEASPDGLTFSPHPNGPLIGSNRLRTVTTAWSNIDTESLESHLELHKAYLDATGDNAKATALELGPQFNDLESHHADVIENEPKVTFWISETESYSMPLTRFVMDENRNRARRIYVSEEEKLKAIKRWRGVYQEIESMNYRPDVIKFQDRLQRAIRAMEKLNPESGVFSHTFAIDMERLILNTQY